jgi:hypothetical protein
MSNEEQHSEEKHEHDFVPIFIDDKPYKAPKKAMTGAELRQLARPPIGADRDLFLVVPGPGDDQKIGDHQVVHLKPGMHFYSAPSTINPGDEACLPEIDERYLSEKGIKWAMSTGGYLLLEGITVSTEKFDRATADVMIRVPTGYPMAALDMFYVSPELKLKDGSHPPAANVFEEHCGRRWQRFSRHLNAVPWRPGVDGLRSFLALVLGELHGTR